MRPLKLSLLIVFSILAFSCSKDDAIPFDESMLKGNWSVKSVHYSGTSTTSILGISTTSKYTGTGIDMNLILQFSDNPNNFLSTGDYSIALSTEVLGVTTTSVVDFNGLMMPGAWILKGNKLIVEAQEEVQEAIIKELNAAKMVLVSVLDNKVTQGGVTITTKINTTFSLEKL